MYYNVTASGAQVLQTGSIPRVLIQVNTALTGTITVTDGSTAVAVITNPVAGNTFEYWTLKNNVTVNPSGVCDITVNVLNSRL